MKKYIFCTPRPPPISPPFFPPAVIGGTFNFFVCYSLLSVLTQRKGALLNSSQSIQHVTVTGLVLSALSPPSPEKSFENKINKAISTLQYI